MSEHSTVQDVERKIRAVATAPTDGFRSLLEVAGVNPKRDLRFHDWSGISFEDQDLRGFDFTGARLANCRFENALIEGARFDRAVLGIGTGSERPDFSDASDWEAFLTRWRPPSDMSDSHLRPGMVFQDAPFAPRMVVHSPVQLDDKFHEASNRIGSSRMLAERENLTALAVSETPISEGDFGMFLDWNLAGSFQALGGGSDQTMLTHKSHVLEYVTWLRKFTGIGYRLLETREFELLGFDCEDATNGEWCASDSHEGPNKGLGGLTLMLPIVSVGPESAPARQRLFNLKRDEVLAAWHTARFRIARELVT